MSTYTDLHNKVKENIAVDYHNRITPQRVRLFNELNEYWGTFKGHVTAEDIKIRGGEISSATLYDAKLSGNINIPGIGDLSAYRQTMEEVSGMAYDASTGLIDEQEARISAVSALNSRIDNIVSSSISSDIIILIDLKLSALSSIEDLKILSVSAEAYKDLSVVSSLLSAEISVVSSLLSTEISQEAENRANADALNTGRINDLRSEFEAEAIQRAEFDDILSGQLSALRRKLSEDYSEITEALEEHCQDNIESFNAAKAEMLSTVLHDKHYTIYGKPEGLFNSYPCKLKDFAMNVVQTTLNTATIVDNKNGNAIVGGITKDDTYVYIKFYDLENDLELRKMIAPNSSYSISKTGSLFVVDGNYMVTYDSLNNRIIVSPTSAASYYKLVYDGIQVGTIDNVSAAADESLISGLLNVDATGELSLFNNFRSKEFSREQPEIAVGAERIELVKPGYTTFKFRKYVSDVLYCPISAYNASTGSNEEVARIISGNIQYDTYGHLTAIAVSCLNNSVELLASKLFSLMFADGLLLSCLVIDNDQGSFSLNAVSAYYKYKMYAENDASMSGPVVGYIVPGKANTTLSARDFNLLSVVLLVPEYPTGTFKLDKVENVPYDIWRGTTDLDNGHITLEYNASYVKIYGITYGVKFYGKFGVNIADSSPDIYDEATTIRNLWTSGQVYWSNSSNYKILSTDAGSYIVNAVGPYDPSIEALQLNITTRDANVLKLLIPDKSTNDISRELMLVFNVKSNYHLSISVDLLSSNGLPIDFYNNKKRSLVLSAGIWTTYLLNEVRYNKFLLTDLNEVDLNNLLKVLSAKVDTEILRSILSDQVFAELLANAQLSIYGISSTTKSLLNDVSSAANAAVQSLSTAVDSHFIHLSGDSNIGDLSLSGKITADEATFLNLNADNLRLSQLSVRFSNLFDGYGEGSLSSLDDLVEPTLLAICNRINEIILYAELGFEPLVVDSEFIRNIEVRTNLICDAAYISKVPTNPSLGELEDALNEAIKHLNYKGTGLSLEARLAALSLKIDNTFRTLSSYSVQLADNISAALSSVDPANNVTFMKLQLTTGADTAVDNLIITDEEAKGTSYDRYRLTFDCGTLVLKKI